MNNDRAIANDSRVLSTKQMRTAVTAATFGNVLEWFDFTVYGLLAGAIANNFFTFSNGQSEAVPLLLTFATFGVGFIARPVGGLLMGLYADRRGRKPALILTILMMGISTALVGVLPSYSAIGVLAPVALVLARLAQGLAAGGEWGGAASFLVEWAPVNRRGLFGAIHPASIFVGLLTGSLVTAAFTSVLGADAMNAWGWRLPFIIGGAICLIALPFRLHVKESPEFIAEKVDEASAPAASALSKRSLTGKLVLTFAIAAMPSAAVYTFVTYYPSFMQNFVKVDGKLIGSGVSLWSNSIAAFIVIAVSLASGALSDRVGRKPVMLVSALLVLVLSAPLLFFATVVNSLTVVIAIQGVLAALVGIFLGPMSAVFVELFPTRVRVAGLNSAYNVSSAIFGGFAPFVAAGLIAATGLPIAASFGVIFAAIITTIAVFTYKETRGVSL